ncbi:hypothetical protein [Alloalcanivorax xenomutans]|uniref:hypothetical protein n=1 Tax=Alloalcanivorax xenomutans TaxID=1094342 RepID=UPI001F19A72B|nr:hypothetical protein [Alloalcanivorax xenomutans]MCE7521959.1 hypothetical protein [Alloalcanivorax xenomutans]
MSRFDHLQALNDGASFHLYGDPARFVAGPIMPDRGDADTDHAILDQLDVLDDQGVVVQTIKRIEYPKAAWPYWRRADHIVMNPGTTNERTWRIENLHRDTGRTLIVEVSEWHGE